MCIQVSMTTDSKWKDLGMVPDTALIGVYYISTTAQMCGHLRLSA